MKLLPFLLILIILFSCQREVDEQLPQETGQELLREMYYLDTTQPVGMDTLGKISLTYDQQRRLIVISQFDPFDGFTIATEFRYSGNSKEAYLSISTAREDDDVHIDSIFYFYSNGIVNADSLVAYSKVPPGRPDMELDKKEVNEYIINGNQVKVLRRTYYHWGSSTPVDMVAADATFTILQSSATVHEEKCDDLNGVAYTNYYKAVFTGALNPLKGLLPAHPVETSSDDYFGISARFERLYTSEQDGTAPFMQTNTYRYQTRADGYPLYEWFERDGDFPEFRKTVYVYR